MLDKNHHYYKSILKKFTLQIIPIGILLLPVDEQIGWIYEESRIVQSAPSQPGEQIFAPVIELHVYELVQSSFEIHRTEHWFP